MEQSSASHSCYKLCCSLSIQIEYSHHLLKVFNKFLENLLQSLSQYSLFKSLYGTYCTVFSLFLTKTYMLLVLFVFVGGGGLD